MKGLLLAVAIGLVGCYAPGEAADCQERLDAAPDTVGLLVSPPTVGPNCRTYWEAKLQRAGFRTADAAEPEAADTTADTTAVTP